MKTMIAAFAMVASTVASAASFKWEAKMNDGSTVTFDKITCRLYQADDANISGNQSDVWVETDETSITIDQFSNNGNVGIGTWNGTSSKTGATSKEFKIVFSPGDMYFRILDDNVWKEYHVGKLDFRLYNDGKYVGGTSSDGKDYSGEANTTTGELGTDTLGKLVDFETKVDAAFSSDGNSISGSYDPSKTCEIDIKDSNGEVIGTLTISVAGFGNVPEPTSGLLLLLGAGMLALRRKAVRA